MHSFLIWAPLLAFLPSLSCLFPSTPILFSHLSCRSQVIIFNERDPCQELNEADSMCRQFKQSRLNHKCAARKSSVDDCLCILPRERLVSKGKSHSRWYLLTTDLYSVWIRDGALRIFNIHTHHSGNRPLGIHWGRRNLIGEINSAFPMCVM